MADPGKNVKNAKHFEEDDLALQTVELEPMHGGAASSRSVPSQSGGGEDDSDDGPTETEKPNTVE